MSENEKQLKLASLIVASNEGLSPVWDSSSGSAFVQPDRMKATAGYADQIKLCRFFAKYDPMASGAITKQIELGFNGYRPRRAQCTEEEYAVFDACKETVLAGLRLMAREYLISGLVVPEASWKQVSGKDLNIKSRPNKRYWIPDTIWVRNPATLVLRKSPIPTQVRVFVRIPPEDIAFINSGGKYPDGSEDIDLFKQLVRDYPNYVQMVRAGKTEVWLEDAVCIRRGICTDELYPTPYLLPALESFQHKRAMKKMDFSIASRVISAIQQITLGNDKYPLTEDDQQLLDELRNQMMWRGLPENVERVFQIFSNHTLNIQWVHPDTKAMLDSTKYAAVNEDVRHALGVPGIIVSGEANRTATSQAEFALLPPTEALRSLRDELLPYVVHLYDQITQKNSFQHTAKPSMPPIKLYDPAKMAQMGEVYYQNGALSKTTWDDLAGFDFENELSNRQEEDALTTEYGLEPTPQVPFSSPKIGGGNTGGGAPGGNGGGGSPAPSDQSKPPATKASKRQQNAA